MSLGGNLYFSIVKNRSSKTKDEYGTKILLHVDKVEGNVGDLEISISGWDVNGCVEIKQYADGRPEEVRQIK